MSKVIGGDPDCPHGYWWCEGKDGKVSETCMWCGARRTTEPKFLDGRSALGDSPYRAELGRRALVLSGLGGRRL